MKQVIPLSPWDLTVAAGLLLTSAAISVALQLGIGKRLVIAGVRTVVQLLLIGLVLQFVFALERWWIVVAVFLSMVINAGIAAVQRLDVRYPGIWSTGLTAVSISAVLTTFAVTEAVIGVEPWYAPRYLIPLLGMVLGNSLTGISLALDRMIGDLRTRRQEIEAWLTVGATSWEAVRPIVADAVRTGIIPILNSMSVAGIVALPGMMTGQILAGAAPVDAVKYQIVVMFMIAGASSLGAVLAAMLSFRRLVTRRHQLALHRIRSA
ncbi:MAG: iron export ABC transporter permease subunit FetB [Myxococcales bacterium]|nr:iron export ABC transporter permease subunit FetB [Myxococcales bacterium]